MSQETPASTTEAQIKNERHISLFWLLPFITLTIASWLIWSGYQDRGNTITIDFMLADGIIPGHTLVHYQGVEVGTVQDIGLSDDLRKTGIKVGVKSDMKNALREETQFWLVTPKAPSTSVSGLDALVGGSYIGMMPGKGKKQDHFVTLDTQPGYRLDNGDLMIHLQAPGLGSLNSGSLVYFRKIPVGKVYDYAINPNEQGVVVDVLIERRFADLVKEGSRFWNVSGVDANVSISDARVRLENLAALVNGAITFDSSEESKPAEAEDTFGLYENLAHSQRDVVIKLELPSGARLTADSAPLMYQGLGVRQLTKLDLNPGGKVTGEVTVDPSVVTLLRENTHIKLRDPKLSLNNTSLNALLTGKTFELVPDDGEPRREFVVVPGEKALLHEPDVLTLILTAPESYGVDAGQPLILHGVRVDQAIDRRLTSKGVTFTVAIEPQHRELVEGGSKFVINSRVDVKVGLDGAEFLGTSASEWINGRIRILPGDEGKMKANYPLYANLERALENSLNDSPVTTVSLSAKALPDVQAGSIVLYRKFKVGEVITVRPQASTFGTDLHIKSEYRNLLTGSSVFWTEGGTKVQLDGSSLTTQASPLSRALKGAINFDSLSGASTNQRRDDRRILYVSEAAARAVDRQVILHAFDTGKLTVGMSIHYLGTDIGQIQTLDLIAARNEVQAKTVFCPEHVQAFTRGNTRFPVVIPQISAASAERLNTILQPYINVEPGRGNPRRGFELQGATITDSRYLDGLDIIVEASEAGSLGIDTPVLFHGLEVGAVTGMTLGTLPDHVVIAIRISRRYQHLVRNNSVFWLASGYSLDSGLTGGVARAGTFSQFIYGDTAFAAPPGTPLAPKAQEGEHLLLRESEPKKWCEWGTALLK